MEEIQTEKKTKAAAIPSLATSANQKTSQRKKDPEAIQEMFDKIARKYDLANGILSFQTHRIWNRKLVQAIGSPSTLLDLCSGTGEIGYRFLKSAKEKKDVLMLDFSSQMLDIARSKSLPFELKGHTLRFIEADATLLPLPTASLDAASMAYGIRNIPSRMKCFQEVRRVLKEGGKFHILELTTPKNPLLRKAHEFYLKKFLPLLGGVITQEKDAYSYLSESVSEFVQPEVLKKELLDSGFKEITITPLTFGIATLILAKA